MSKNAIFILLFTLMTSTLIVSGQTVYFLVGEIVPPDPVHNDSYVLPLTEPNDITHGRDLISSGPGIGNAIVVAEITPAPDGINRNHHVPGKPSWSWHVTNFIGFSDLTAEILDGWPGLVENDVDWWMNNTGGQIGFWDYTVIDELPTNVKNWRYDLNLDGIVDSNDLRWFAGPWLSEDCNTPDWCDRTDFDKSGDVDNYDFTLLGKYWQDVFTVIPECWSYPRQCHGDTDNEGTGKGSSKKWVTLEDLNTFNAAWPSQYYYDQSCFPGPCYNPCADFDHDGDVDDCDEDIISFWYNRTDVPADCTNKPSHGDICISFP